MEEVNRLTAKRNMMLADLKENLNQAQNHMRQQVNKHRRDIQFEVGDRAYLKIKPYKLKSLAKRVNQKFSSSSKLAMPMTLLFLFPLL